MDNTKRQKTEEKGVEHDIIWIGVVYFTNLDGECPKVMLKVRQQELEEDDWLVETLVRVFPDHTSFGWNGCHVMLTSKNDFNLGSYHPPEMHGSDDNMIEFSCEDIHTAFMENPKWNKKEEYGCV